MTRFTLTLLLIAATSTFSYAQEIKMSEDAKKAYVTKERTKGQVSRAQSVAPATQSQPEDAPPAYVALDLIRMEGDETLKVIFDPGSSVRQAKHMSEDLQTIEKLEEVIGQFTSDIDVLNYVANMGWDVVSVTRSKLEAPQRGSNTRVYIRKILQE